ncbi:MAG: two-component system LytT family sensor kinase [Crocinitomix sp.]|jgi:two-component system LytT family sensor kinase
MNNLVAPFKSIRQFLLINFIIGAVSCLIFVEDPFGDLSRFLIGTLWGATIFITQTLGHSFIQTQISKRYTWIEKPIQRLVLTVVSVVIYAVVAFVIVQIIMNYLVFGSVPDYLLKFDIRGWVTPIVISFFVSLLAAAYGFFVSLKNSIIEKEVLKGQMLSYKYEALRNQINPHFMFNSLNVLSDLVYEDQDTAVKFIHQFSGIYRYVLDSREKELVPLQEEIDFIEKFIFLLKTRFENKLIINLDIKAESDELIVPLALQLLIENAVKHNEISSANPLEISISRSTDSITVVNPILLKNINNDSKQIGLTNLIQQYAYFSNREPEIQTKDDRFLVTLPILKRD